MANRHELKLRVWQEDEIAIGPGKIDMLEAILQHGSISGAARSIGMSYRRAWLLVDTMNRCFREPLVTTSAGGNKGGGADVTKAGIAVIKHYRNMQQKADAAIQTDYKKILKMLVVDVPNE